MTNEDAPAEPQARAISAIVVSYFTGPLLARSLASLRAQPDVARIILVDNGNWEGAVAAAIDAAVESVSEGAEIEVLTGHGNVGFATACNLGATRCRSPYLLFLNPDALMPEGGAAIWLERAAALARPFMIGPKLVDPDGSEQQGSRRETLTPWRAFVEATRLYALAPKHPYFRRFNNHDEPCPDELTPTPTISGACFFLPREDYFAIGGMDERYFLHVEDVDFCLRFREAGGIVYFDPAISVRHFKSSSRVNAMRVERRKTISILLYFKTHFSEQYPAPFHWLVAAALWMVFGLRLMKRAVARGFGLIGLGPFGAARRRALRIAAQRAGR